MKDRNVEFPNRYRMVKVPGTDDIFDLTPAPGEISDEGTFINKATLLKDATAALFGLGADAVPDDVLGVLSRFQSGLGNDYVWEKLQYEESLTQVAGSNSSGTYYVYLCSTQGGSSSCQYSEKIAFDESGSPYLVDPVTATVSSLISNPAVLKGKYFHNPSPLTNEGWATALVKIAEDANVSTLSSVTVRVLQGGAFYVSSSKSSAGYVNSADPNAYPIDDGYTYVALGQLAQKMRIATGSYTGTSVYGVNNPNSLRFNFAPKMIFVLEERNNGRPLVEVMFASPLNLQTTYLSYGYCVFVAGTSGAKFYAKFVDETFYWYADSVANQFNESAYKYYYIAIG